MQRSPVIDVARLKAEFQTLYGAPAQVFSAPGRINLIGEHTDYNEGFVLPMAIERRTYVVAATRPGRIVNVHSFNASSQFSFDLNRPGPGKSGSWIDYVEGTVQAMRKRGIVVPALDML